MLLLLFVAGNLLLKLGGGFVVYIPRNYIVVVATSLLVAGCAGTSTYYSPADVQPVYQIRNSPIPVPHVRWNPRRNSANKVATAVVKKPVVKPSIRTKVASSHISVRKGDTLYALSRRHSVPVRSLISANGLRAPYSLAVGQKLKVPSANTHTVRRGDTGYSISRQYGVTVSSLMRVNGIRAPYGLAVGQKLNLPGGAKATGSVQTASAAGDYRPAGRPAVKSASPKGRSIAMPTPPPRSRSGFIWPVSGKLASRFGPREGGLHNDGINILAKAGTAVKAADAGVVVYASNALEGYGNLLLLKHSGGWVTAYAHNERILVRPGQKIKRGQVVARVGSTGGVKTSQLHFEIRKGRRALDPLRHLSGKTAAGG